MLLREVSSLISHLYEYPYWLSSDNPGSIVRKDDRPLVFVHGFLSNPGIWKMFFRRFSLLGWRNLHYHYYSVLRRDLDQLVTRFSYYIDDVLEVYEYDTKISFICHSLGGVIVRDWATRNDNHRWVDKVITVGTPNHGTKFANLGFILYPHKTYRIARDMKPGSRYLQELNSRPQPPEVKWYNIYSPKDEILVPYHSARYPKGWDTQNFLVKNAGHLSLVYSCYVTLLCHNILYREAVNK